MSSFPGSPTYWPPTWKMPRWPRADWSTAGTGSLGASARVAVGASAIASKSNLQVNGMTVLVMAFPPFPLPAEFEMLVRQQRTTLRQVSIAVGISRHNLTSVGRFNSLTARPRKGQRSPCTPADAARPHADGVMFWFTRKRLAGSYFFFTDARRA